LTYNIYFLIYFALGGNQRDLARAKNMKKQQELTKAKNEDGLTPLQRRER
jgi:hypothetical protein